MNDGPLTAMLAILSRQTYERVSFLRVRIACCQMFYKIFETIMITFIESNITMFQNVNKNLKASIF